MRQSDLVRVKSNEDGNLRKAQTMWDGGVTPVLEAWLVMRGDIKRPVGAGSLEIDVGAPRGRGETHPLADAAQREEPRVRLVWTNLRHTAGRQLKIQPTVSLKVVK